ncbi:hypothetical protein F2Q70_00004442 [Brassica cretica]|uniref:RNase H type-1 domain-containing protein n=1 Tax=Brassica cretica TaxID=69181 RepID=A0A8S9IZH4_BRACR|nr:hypothetical protein F2Q70_00004442 [Brassica cretica]
MSIEIYGIVADIFGLALSFDLITFHWISCERNKEADFLAKQILSFEQSIPYKFKTRVYWGFTSSYMEDPFNLSLYEFDHVIMYSIFVINSPFVSTFTRLTPPEQSHPPAIISFPDISSGPQPCSAGQVYPSHGFPASSSTSLSTTSIRESPSLSRWSIQNPCGVKGTRVPLSHPRNQNKKEVLDGFSSSQPSLTAPALSNRPGSLFLPEPCPEAPAF